jgi:anhydro-N-acetylmuramic acid kinase
MASHYIGLMSGTSLDGIDAVLAVARGKSLRLEAALHRPFSPRLRKQLLALQAPGPDELHRAAIAANQVTRAYATAVRSLLSRARLSASSIAAIGCHGQTVRHQPGAGYTAQLVSGALLAELTGIDVVCDFRSRDIAAGGEGAPLVPAFHSAVFRAPSHGRAVVNIGGIANLTSLPSRGPVTGFDCGPGNGLLDAWIDARRRRRYDRGGAWAAQGRVLPRLLEKLLADPYFRRRPPKSTGRETFNLSWLRRRLAPNLRGEDVQATLLELTACTIARAVRNYCADAAEVLVCGGGARNCALVARIATLLPGRRVVLTDDAGIAAQHVEALAFAWLARQCLKRKPGNLPSVTGARGPRVLGAIYPA